jgi:hypothetical protein
LDAIIKDSDAMKTLKETPVTVERDMITPPLQWLSGDQCQVGSGSPSINKIGRSTFENRWCDRLLRRDGSRRQTWLLLGEHRDALQATSPRAVARSWPVSSAGGSGGRGSSAMLKEINR